nr:60S ribosomal protein L13A [Cryptomonas sp.]
MKILQVINGNGHLIGRLASVCAKQLLNGKKIVVVHCEKIEISGKEIKNKYKYLSLRKKRTNTNPRRGPFHFRSPSQIFWKVVRGMLPHKTKRGTNALMNLRVYEGVPPSLVKMKKFVIPEALRILRLSPGRKYSKLENISNQIGWTKKTLIAQMNNERNVKNKYYHINKTILIRKKTSKLLDNVNLDIFQMKIN